MALDVYVGSLTRYYAGDWESVGDRTSRERGRQTEGGRPRAAGVPKKDRERLQASVLAWRRTLDGALAPHLAEPLAWNETSESPWFTDRPDWDGFGSLVLWAAYAEQPTLRRPAALPREWDDDAALVRSNAEGFRSRYSHLVRNVESGCRPLSTSPSRPRTLTAGVSSSAPRRRCAASSASSTPRPGRWMTTRWPRWPGGARRAAHRSRSPRATRWR